MKEPLTDWLPIVKPASRYDETRPIIAVTAHAIMIENGRTFLRTSEDGDARQDLLRVFRDSPAAIFACDRALPILGELQELFEGNARFQFEVFSMPKEAFNPEWTAKGYKAITTTYVVNRAGLRATEKRFDGVWHLLLDCVDMSGGLPEDMVVGKNRMEALMKWGQTMRKLVRDFDIRARPTNGGVAAQILRSPRFYPRSRRRVPLQTNENCRPGLRGNLYDYSRVEPTTVYEHVLEIDQHNAHHAAAASITLPSSDSLFARYNYRDPHRPVNGGLLHTSREFEKELSRCGQLLVTLHVPRLGETFAPNFLKEEGPVHIFTNEIPYMRKLGIEVRSIIAAWTGDPEPEGEGISAYAEYCGELEGRVSASEWRVMKRTLLTLYGVLGARVRATRRHYAQSSHDVEAVEIKAGHRTLKTVAADPGEREPFTANIIQRGMIEAETAWRSVSLANEMVAGGHRVLVIYADALYIQSDEPPLLKTPWRIKQEMRTVQFPRPAVVIGRAANGSAIQKIPGGLRRELESRARRPWEVSVDNAQQDEYSERDAASDERQVA